jgi:D-alanyl-D-alanine carboxypeptidase
MIKRISCALFSVMLLLMLSGCHLGTPDDDTDIGKHEKLSEILNEAKEEYNIPAVGAIILNSGIIIDKAIIGVRSVDGVQPVTFSDHFHLGSNTKAITGFIAGKLVEDGIITWDKQFFDLFPDLKAGAREDYYNITLSDLLSHRAYVLPLKTGVSDVLEQIPLLEGDIKDKRIAFSAHILKEKPVKSLFGNYKYSNAGYVLAAAMLEEAGGMSWEDLVQRVLVEDLGLSVNAGWPIEIDDNQPRGHLPGSYVDEETGELIIYDKEYHYENDDILNPAGDLNINMLDYAEYIQLNLQGLNGNDNYLSSKTYQYMHFGIPDYSIGWENSRKDNYTISEHSGSKGNFFCHTYIVKEKDMAVIVFANSGILNALNKVEYFLGGIKLNNYLKEIENLY